MQAPPPLPHTWTDFFWLALASGLGIGGSQWYTAWKGRRKPVQEIHESEARTELARFQATQSISESLRDISAQLKESKSAIHDLEQRFDGQQEYISILEFQNAKARAQGFLAEDRLPGSPNPAA